MESAASNLCAVRAEGACGFQRALQKRHDS